MDSPGFLDELTKNPIEKNTFFLVEKNILNENVEKFSKNVDFFNEHFSKNHFRPNYFFDKKKIFFSMGFF